MRGKQGAPGRLVVRVPGGTATIEHLLTLEQQLLLKTVIGLKKLDAKVVALQKKLGEVEITTLYTKGYLQSHHQVAIAHSKKIHRWVNHTCTSLTFDIWLIHYDEEAAKKAGGCNWKY